MITVQEYKDQVERYVSRLRRIRFSSSLRERNADIERLTQSVNFRQGISPYLPFILLIGPRTVTIEPLTHDSHTIQRPTGPAWIPTPGIQFGTLSLEGNSGNLESIYELIQEWGDDPSIYLNHLGDISNLSTNRFPDFPDPAAGDFLERFYRLMSDLADTPSVKRRTYERLKEWTEEPNTISSSAETFVNRKIITIVDPIYPYGKTYAGWTTGFTENTNAEQFRRFEWSLQFQILSELQNDFILHGAPPQGTVIFSSGEIVTLPPITIPPPVVTEQRLLIEHSNVGLDNTHKAGSKSFECAKPGPDVIVTGTGNDTRYDLKLAIIFTEPVNLTVNDVSLVLSTNTNLPPPTIDSVTLITDATLWPDYGGAFQPGRSWIISIKSIPGQQDQTPTTGIITIKDTTTAVADPARALPEHTISLTVGPPCPIIVKPPTPFALQDITTDKRLVTPCDTDFTFTFTFTEDTTLTLESIQNLDAATQKSKTDKNLFVWVFDPQRRSVPTKDVFPSDVNIFPEPDNNSIWHVKITASDQTIFDSFHSYVAFIDSDKVLNANGQAVKILGSSFSTMSITDANPSLFTYDVILTSLPSLATLSFNSSNANSNVQKFITQDKQFRVTIIFSGSVTGTPVITANTTPGGSITRSFFNSGFLPASDQASNPRFQDSVDALARFGKTTWALNQVYSEFLEVDNATHPNQLEIQMCLNFGGNCGDLTEEVKLINCPKQKLPNMLTRVTLIDNVPCASIDAARTARQILTPGATSQNLSIFFKPAIDDNNILSHLSVTVNGRSDSAVTLTAGQGRAEPGSVNVTLNDSNQIKQGKQYRITYDSGILNCPPSSVSFSDPCTEFRNKLSSLNDSAITIGRASVARTTRSLNSNDVGSGWISLKAVTEEPAILVRVNFGFNDASLTPASATTLSKIVDLLRQYANINFNVDGHTDNRLEGRPLGPDDIKLSAFNLDLSQKRVDTVVSFLTNNGIDPGRVTKRFYGETIPLIPNSFSENGTPENRRVEFVLDCAQ